MNKIMIEDEKLGDVRNHASENQSISKTITDYAGALRELDFSACPEHFTQAFEDHIQAWEDILPVTDKYPDIRGELHELFKQIEASPDSVEFKRGVAEIWSTWEDVEKAIK